MGTMTVCTLSHGNVVLGGVTSKATNDFILQDVELQKNNPIRKMEIG